VYDLCCLRQIMLDVKRIEEALKQETSLTLNEALCLCQNEKGHTDPSSLARELSISPSRMTRILDSLHNQECISRTQTGEDRRTVTITMTKKGVEVLKKLHALSLDLPEYVITLAKESEKNT